MEQNIDTIISDMTDNIPDIQPHVVNKSNENEGLNSVPDNRPEVFNPDIHRANPDGSPILTKTGKFRKKTVKKLNMPGQKTANGEKPDMATMIQTNSRAAAEVVQNLKRSVYDKFLDTTYGNERHAVHVEATTSYFVSQGGVQLSPLHTLLILEGSLICEAFTKPKNISKLTSVKAWFASKIIKIKGRRKNGTQSDNRPDDMRENETSPENA